MGSSTPKTAVLIQSIRVNSIQINQIGARLNRLTNWKVIEGCRRSTLSRWALVSPIENLHNQAFISWSHCWFMQISHRWNLLVWSRDTKYVIFHPWVEFFCFMLFYLGSWVRISRAFEVTWSCSNAHWPISSLGENRWNSKKWTMNFVEYFIIR